MRELVIDKPQSLTMGQQIGQRLVTGLFWGLFLYFLRPLFSLFAWVLGVVRFREIMIIEEGIYDLLHLLKWYFLIIVAMVIIFEGWALYNLLRFRRRDRRRPAVPVGTAEVAAFFRVAPRRLASWQNAVCLHINHENSGNIVSGERYDSGRSTPLRQQIRHQTESTSTTVGPPP